MSLLRDIQKAAISSDTQISELLRKCQVLAARLGNNDFESWVDAELNGYKSVKDLPEYRVLDVISYGNFSGSFNSGLTNVNIPLGCLPEDVREEYSHSYFCAPISYYESLIKDFEQGEGSIKEPWPPDVVGHVARKIYRNMNCFSAWKHIPRGSIVSLVDVVRNRVLKFVLEIEAENPEAGEAPINSNPVSQDKVTHIFNTYISGSVQNLAAGSTNVKQDAKIELHNDISALCDYLRNQNVPESDLEELRGAIEDDKKTNPHQDSIGPKVTLWLSSMFKKAAIGAWNISAGVATTILTKAISKYYGLE